MAAILRTYSRNFERRPYLTLCVANSVLMSIGDVSAQLIGLSSGASLAFDLERTMRFAVFGASMGPLGGAWNKFLEVNFPLRRTLAGQPATMAKVKVENPIPGLEKELPKGSRLERGAPQFPAGAGALSGGPATEANVSVVQLAKRVAADQFGMAPISLFIFLFSMSLLEGLDQEQTREKIASNYWPILFVNWQVWPIFQTLNFRYVPLRYRVPVGSIAGIVWTCFLSTRVGVSSA
ncbi:Mpv17/PMP22 family protein [Rhodotorula paludigena]|uniref:Mpv17/PMP22 family protein n=1 Tax=Rhodotorula paludigena TaxID=86838 RepID=UPI00317EAE2C